MPMPRGLDQIAHLEAPAAILHLDWSPDGSELAVALKRGQVRIWDWVRERPRADLSPPERVDLKQVSWSPGGELIAACSEKTIDLWEPFQGRHLDRCELPGRLLSAAWSTDSCAFNIALLEGSPSAPRLVLSTWNRDSGELARFRENPAWEDAYYGLSWDRRWLALARTDGLLKLWDLRSLQRRTFESEYREIGAVAVSREQATLAVSFGGEVDLWNLMTGEPIPPLGGDRARIYSLAFSPGGEVLAGKSRNGTVRLWWCEDWTESTSIPEPSVGNQQAEIAFHPREPRLATYDRMNMALRIWDLDLEEIRVGRKTMRKRKVLFLSSDLDAGFSPLQAGLEIREIRERLNLGDHWDRFEFHSETAVRAVDIQRALQQVRPEIVHFAGHGDSQGSIFVDGRHGKASKISQRALTNLFGLVSKTVECVVLNACHSEAQARSISQIIKHVIGMSSRIDDRSAIEFSTGFYQALGNGGTIREAYGFGCSLIEMGELPGPEIPVLFEQGEAVPNGFVTTRQESGVHHGFGAFAEEPSRLAQELRRFRDQSLRALIERLLEVQGNGGERMSDFPRLAHILSSEIFGNSAHRDIQSTAATAGWDSDQRLLERIQRRLRDEGFAALELAERGLLACLVTEMENLRRRIKAPGMLTFSLAGQPFDPLLHEIYSVSPQDEGERVVDLSLFPGYRVSDSLLLKELVSVTSPSIRSAGSSRVGGPPAVAALDSRAVLTSPALLSRGRRGRKKGRNGVGRSMLRPFFYSGGFSPTP